MPDSLAAMLALFNDNTAGDISAADGRAVIQALYDWIPPIEKYKMGRLPGETAHADDDFFTAYSGYTEVSPIGTPVWALRRGGLGVQYVGVHGHGVAIKPIPAAGLPITIETFMTPATAAEANATCGLVFTSGTGTTASFAGFGPMTGAGGVTGWALPSGTLNSPTANQTAGGTMAVGMSESCFIRLVWSAANTFEFAVSSDGDNWVDFGKTTFTRTFTPTHMGFHVSNWNPSGGLIQAATFRYLRVYEADLSV